MTNKEYLKKLDEAEALLEEYLLPGTFTLVDNAPPEAEAALKMKLEYLKINSCYPK